MKRTAGMKAGRAGRSAVAFRGQMLWEDRSNLRKLTGPRGWVARRTATGTGLRTARGIIGRPAAEMTASTIAASRGHRVRSRSSARRASARSIRTVRSPRSPL